MVKCFVATVSTGSLTMPSAGSRWQLQVVCQTRSTYGLVMAGRIDQTHGKYSQQRQKQRRQQRRKRAGQIGSDGRVIGVPIGIALLAFATVLLQFLWTSWQHGLHTTPSWQILLGGLSMAWIVVLTVGNCGWPGDEYAKIEVTQNRDNAHQKMVLGNRFWSLIFLFNSNYLVGQYHKWVQPQ